MNLSSACIIRPSNRVGAHVNMKYAILDIGSNSVRLMLWADGKTLYKEVLTTRLGEGLSASGLISDAAEKRTIPAIVTLLGRAKGEDAEVLAFATAAVRGARNGPEFVSAVKRECGVDIDVVSGEAEALLGLRGALGMRDGGIIDIGGASTEVCLQREGKVVYSVSLPVGCVRLHDACGEDVTLLTSVIEQAISPLPAIELPLYAVGGTASTLASVRLGLKQYDGAALQNAILSRNWLKCMANYLLSAPLEDRKRIRGMDVTRADILGGGTLLLTHILQRVGANEVRFSDGDNLEGYAVYRGLK